MGPDAGRTGNTVENYGWGKEAAIEKWLFAEGHRFDFFQAVRLLEMIQAANGRLHSVEEAGRNGGTPYAEPGVSPGEGADPSKETVHFKSAVSLDFPSSDIAGVSSGNGAEGAPEMVAHFKTRKMPAEVTVNFLGLAGCHGALDTPTTELILQRTSRNDVALRDFLDIFNHRLVSLLYRIRKLHRVGLGVAEPGKDHISRYLYALIGLETPKLKGRMHVRDRALLYYAGILAHQTRSMAGLERMLSDYFQVPVKGRQFSGKWCDLEENQWTIIGESGRNQRLGQDMVVVGTRVWDEHARFDIHLGPLSLKDFISFLPTNYHFGVLCDLIRFYVKDEFDFNIRLILNADEIPGTKLWPTAPELPELAWTAWLGVPQARSVGSNGNGAGSKDKPEDPYITISPEALEAESPSLKSRILYRLPRGKQEALLDMMTPRTVPKHSVVMAQDKPGTHMFVIRSGTVQLFRREAQGKERLMGILNEGDSFGELALLTRKPYSETALALTKCQLAVVDRQQLDALVLKYPRLQRTIDSYLHYGDPGKQSVDHLEKRRR